MLRTIYNHAALLAEDVWYGVHFPAVSRSRQAVDTVSLCGAVALAGAGALAGDPVVAFAGSFSTLMTSLRIGEPILDNRLILKGIKP